MSRRMDREGMHRMEPQGIKNQRFWDDPRCKEDERGWVQPFTTWQGWQEFNRATYALRSAIFLKGLPGALNAVRLEDDLRTFHFSIARSRRCDRPSLP